MAFQSSHEAETRVLEAAKLTPEEVRDLVPWMRGITPSGMRRLKVELDLQNLEAIQNFENSSSELTRWLIGFTIARVVLTVIIAYYTVPLARATPNH